MVGDFFKGYSQIDCSFNFNINPIQMGLIGAAHGCGEGGGGEGGAKRRSSLKSVTWHSYTLPKEDPKNT